MRLHEYVAYGNAYDRLSDRIAINGQMRTFQICMHSQVWRGGKL